MQLTIQQKYLLALLKKLGCARRDQLYALALNQDGLPGGRIKSNHVDAMLNQLRHCASYVRLDGNLAYYGRDSPNTKRLEAVDIMLQLTNGKPLDFWVERDSALLLRFTFESEGKIRLFGVARYSKEQSISAKPTERIVFLTDQDNLPSGLALPYKHFFALRQQDGAYRFFASGD